MRNTPSGETEYLIRWWGHGAAADTWEPAHHILDRYLIDDFERAAKALEEEEDADDEQDDVEDEEEEAVEDDVEGASGVELSALAKWGTGLRWRSGGGVCVLQI